MIVWWVSQIKNFESLLLIRLQEKKKKTHFYYSFLWSQAIKWVLSNRYIYTLIIKNVRLTYWTIRVSAKIPTSKFYNSFVHTWFNFSNLVKTKIYNCQFCYCFFTLKRTLWVSWVRLALGTDSDRRWDLKKYQMLHTKLPTKLPQLSGKCHSSKHVE